MNKNRAGAMAILFAAGAAVLIACGSGGGGAPGDREHAPRSFTIGGNATGLAGAGLVLQNNGADDLAVVSNGSFTFATKMAAGAAYQISILTQPAGLNQTCAAVNNAGTVAEEDVAGVAISCVTNKYRIGGSVSGLAGAGLKLKNNGGDDLSISSNGTFTFTTPLDDGTDYAVSVAAQPGGPSQTCSASSNAGKVAGGDVAAVAVICNTNTYPVGGVVSGLSGSVLVLRNNGVDELSVVSNGSFTFTSPLADGSGYAVTVKTQPAGQNCLVTSGTGTLAGAPVATAAVACSCLDWWPDTDGDGYGDDTATPVSACVAVKAGYALQAGDCNDGNGAVNPAAAEVCDRIDNNCDGQVDEGVHFGNTGQTCCAWTLKTEYDACITAYLASGPSYDPTLLPCVTAAQASDPNYWLCYDPGDSCDYVDNNVNGKVDEGQLKCGNPVHCPQTEVCNGQDDNCDGNVDEGGVCGDCTWAFESCDGCDNDCDGIADNLSITEPCLKDDDTVGTRTCKPPQFVPVGKCAAGGGWTACM